jgi:hypothetical protein
MTDVHFSLWIRQPFDGVPDDPMPAPDCHAVRHWFRMKKHLVERPQHPNPTQPVRSKPNCLPRVMVKTTPASGIIKTMRQPTPSTSPVSQ